jgi:hypothetical protein
MNDKVIWQKEGETCHTDYKTPLTLVNKAAKRGFSLLFQNLTFFFEMSKGVSSKSQRRSKRAT